MNDDVVDGELVPMDTTNGSKIKEILEQVVSLSPEEKAKLDDYFGSVVGHNIGLNGQIVVHSVYNINLQGDASNMVNQLVEALGEEVCQKIAHLMIDKLADLATKKNG